MPRETNNHEPRLASPRARPGVLMSDRTSQPEVRTAILRDARLRRLLAVGLLTSMVRWLDVLTFSVFAYQQTRSAFWVASMMMLRMLPLALFGVAFGAIAGRIPRRTGLLVSQGALLATTLLLLIVAGLGALNVWHLAAASVVSGIVWAGDMPMRRAFIGDVVGPSRMSQAMALDAVANNGSRLAGPGLGGLLLATGGMPAVLSVGALLYVAVIAALVGLPRSGAPRADDKPLGSVGSMLAGGFRAVRETPRLAATLTNTIIFNIFCWPVISMVPVIGKERLNLSIEGVGLLASMDGLGSLVGAVMLAALARRLNHGIVYMGGTVLFLAMLPVFALSVHPWLSGLALIAIGAGQGGFAVMQSTLVFLSAPPRRRLEAMGLMTTCIGIAPLGFVMVGRLAERLGAPGAAIACSAGGLLTVVLTWRIWRPCLQA
jgi:MFS family permease